MLNREGGNVQGEELDESGNKGQEIKKTSKVETTVLDDALTELGILKSALDFIFAKADMGFRNNVSESKAKNTFLEIRKAAAGALKR